MVHDSSQPYRSERNTFRSRGRRNDRTQPTRKILAILQTRKGGGGILSEEDAEQGDSGEPAPREWQMWPSSDPLQREGRLCLPAADGRQQYLLRHRIGQAGHRTPWDCDPIPDHTTPVRLPLTFPPGLNRSVVGRDYPPLLDEADEATDPLGSDSSA